jgi:integral membrane protein (TIGR00529 family)
LTDRRSGERRRQPIPAIFKILIVFGLVLCLNRFRLQLSLSLLVGAVVLGLWMGMDPFQWLLAALRSLTRFQTVSLVLIVGLILVLSRIMDGAGQMKRLVDRFTQLARDPRTVGSVMTAMIGLLPMPGGALFSAPLVETSMCGQDVSGEQKTLLNYWFRHIWEYWWPLYPGVVLAVALLKVETWLYMLFMAPLSLISVLAGVFFILKPLGKVHANGGDGRSWLAFKNFVWEMMPILVVIIVIALIGAVTGALGLFGINLKVSGALSILPGLLAAITWVCVVNRVPRVKIRSAFLDRAVLPMLFLVMAIMIFQGTLTESQAVLKIRNELTDYHVPLVLVVALMPFLSGLITGLAVGFVGVSFPLVIPMFPTGSFWDYMSYAALAYTFGYMGMMLSPIHLCFLVTKDFFKASLLKSYPRLLMSALTVMATVIVVFVVLRISW